VLILDVTGTMKIKDENMNGRCEWWQKGLYYRKRVCIGRGIAVERWGKERERMLWDCEVFVSCSIQVLVLIFVSRNRHHTLSDGQIAISFIMIIRPFPSDYSSRTVDGGRDIR
jgi:hypothetical protein